MNRVREWKPGDVAMAPSFGVVIADPSGLWRKVSDGKELSTPWDGRDDRIPFLHVRPLVVIDPKDREQVERLAALFRMERVKGDRDAIVGGSTDAMQAALREFADLKPRIEEPAGLGAVVEDAEGALWVRVDDPVHSWVAARRSEGAYTRRTKWDQIDVVRVLSEGVAADA